MLPLAYVFDPLGASTHHLFRGIFPLLPLRPLLPQLPSAFTPGAIENRARQVNAGGGETRTARLRARY